MARPCVRHEPAPAEAGPGGQEESTPNAVCAVNIFRRASINSDPAVPPPGARANVAGGQKAGSARSRGSEGPVLT